MAATYILGPFRLDAETDTLFRGGEPVSLGQRAVSLLRVLVEQRGIPVSKDALMEAAWAGLTVEESNLAVQIGALRRVFGEEPGGENWIETLPDEAIGSLARSASGTKVPSPQRRRPRIFPWPPVPRTLRFRTDHPSPFCRFRTSARTLNKSTSPMAWPMKSSRRCHAFRRCLSSRGTPASLTRAGPST